MTLDLDVTVELPALDLPVAPTVLIVDDDPTVLLHLQALVAAAGFDVLTAVDGVEALQQLEQSCASIVITDLNMPRMNGLELCRRIRARKRPGYVYTMLLTIREEEKDILAGLDAGADDYLSKRMSGAHFTARLRTARRVLALEYSLKLALAKNRDLAMTDPLTGTFNRRYFTKHLRRELARLQRGGGELSLILLDVDHFKRVNDSFGHAAGDAVLQGLTGIIARCFQRETDWCARLGGEEFVVVLGGATLAQAHACAEKLRQTIAETPIETGAGAVTVTVSIGISGTGEVLEKTAAAVGALLQIADTNLYASKSAGRNCVTWSGTCKPAPAQSLRAVGRGS